MITSIILLAGTVPAPSQPATSQPWFIALIIVLAGGGLVNVGWEIVKYFRGGQRRKDRADAADAALKVATDTQQAPLVRDSLLLGNYDKALAIQQQVINGLNAQIEADRVSHAKAIKARDEENNELRVKLETYEKRLEERDVRIDELERELEAIEVRMSECQRIIRELRQDHDQEQAQKNGDYSL